MGLALGYEFRRLYGAFIPDPISVAGESTGNFSLATRGGYHVNEGYAELSIPVFRNVALAITPMQLFEVLDRPQRSSERSAPAPERNRFRSEPNSISSAP